MYKYEYNEDTKQFDVIELHSNIVMETATNIGHARKAIKRLESKNIGFQGVTPKFIMISSNFGVGMV
jgi:hypothetical protein